MNEYAEKNFKPFLQRLQDTKIDEREKLVVAQVVAMLDAYDQKALESWDIGILLEEIDNYIPFLGYRLE